MAAEFTVKTNQQTFVGLQDVLKTSSRNVLKTSSTRLQRNNFTSSKKTFSRPLARRLGGAWRPRLPPPPPFSTALNNHSLLHGYYKVRQTCQASLTFKTRQKQNIFVYSPRVSNVTNYFQQPLQYTLFLNLARVSC